MIQENNARENAGEHILVCISPSPSNRRIVKEAAKLARAFRAEFTALYVERPNIRKLGAAEKERLQGNIRYAEDLGATITTVIGENVPIQIAEFARVSDVTKIVIGRSYTKEYYIFGKQSIPDHLISIAPNVDIYIIPDSDTDYRKQDKKRYTERILPSWKDLFITVSLLLAVTAVGMGFDKLGFTEANIITLYLLGVLLSAVLTRSHLYSLLSSLFSVLLFNYFFTDPKLTLHVYEPGYLITFVIMLLVAILTGSLAYRLKNNARESAGAAYRTKILFDTNRLLQKCRTAEAVWEVAAKQVILLTDKEVCVYPVVGGSLDVGQLYKQDGSVIPAKMQEEEVVRWVYTHRKRAGATTRMFPKAQGLYLAIRTGEACYGVMGILVDNKVPGAFEYSVLLSILGECALALENLVNEQAKEEAALLAHNEKIRADLLRSISHDLRTPLTSISGNAGNLCAQYKMMDDATREQIFSDIYDDSEWLIHLVENLLSVTRIENGEMQINRTVDVLDDVVDEAMRHIDRNRTDHRISVVRPREFVLAQMDAKLMVQVIINLVNNAIKYTKPGSQILVSYGLRGEEAYVCVADDGPGMDARTKAHAFDMFFTGANKVADSKRGMGLGLALCKSVMEAHGGRIEVTDNVPSGCVVTCYLHKGDVNIHE